MKSTKAMVAEYRWTGKIAHGAQQRYSISAGFFISSYCENAAVVYETPGV